VLGVWLFLGFSYYIMFMLSPFLAPFVAPWAPRTQEKLADRLVVDLGYGAFLAEVFTGREFERAQAWQNAQRPGLKGALPLDSRTITYRDTRGGYRAGPACDRHKHDPRQIRAGTASVRVVDVLPANSTGSANLSKMIGTLVFALSSAIVASTGAVDHNVTLTPE